MTQKRYKHIFFDLDNTLWDFTTNSYHALKIAFNEFKIERQYADYDYFYEVYTRNNKMLWRDYRLKKVVKKELIKLRFQNTFDELGIKRIDPRDFNEYYLNEMPKQKALIDGVPELLDYLKSKRYYLYIITNGFREVQHKKLKNSGLTEYFTRIYISEDIKIPKPGYEIFEYAVKSANARKNNSIMVGDDIESDIKGANNFGIDAVHFCREKSDRIKIQNYEFLSANMVYSIKSIGELKSFL